VSGLIGATPLQAVFDTIKSLLFISQNRCGQHKTAAHIPPANMRSLTQFKRTNKNTISQYYDLDSFLLI